MPPPISIVIKDAMLYAARAARAQPRYLLRAMHAAARQERHMPRRCLMRRRAAMRATPFHILMPRIIFR